MKEGTVMKEVFKNTGSLVCIFTEEGVSLYGKQKEAFYPYGSIKGIHVNLFGALVLGLGSYESTFLIEKEDRPRMKALLKDIKERIKKAEPEEFKIYGKCSKVPGDLPPEEQMKLYKDLFVTGTISKGYYDMKKRLLTDK